MFTSSSVRRRTLAVITGSLFATGMGSARASPSNDAWITTKTKIALIAASHMSASAVHVDTADARVLLHGSVATKLERQNAESIASGVKGVLGVQNLLQVVPRSRANIFAISDERMKSQIESELKSDSCLATGSVKVKSVDKGIVLLSGKTRDLGEYLAALERASLVPGVRGVVSEVSSIDTLENLEGFSSRPGARCGARDAWTTMSTKLKLIGDRLVPALQIHVDTRDGNVTLFGIVPSTAAKDAAEIDAKRVDGTRGVTNELQVVEAAGRALVDATDQIVARDVKTVLAQSDFKHIGVSVKDGVARLTGKVPSGWERLEAATLARATTGVRAVDDAMTP